jgi:hypothetical protein
MRVYRVKQRNMASTDITSTHGTVLEMVPEAEEVRRKIFMDKYFNSPKLFSDLHHRKINARGTARRCCLTSVLNIYDWRKETLCSEYLEM